MSSIVQKRIHYRIICAHPESFDVPYPDAAIELINKKISVLQEVKLG